MSTGSETDKQSRLDRSTIRLTPAGRRYVGFLAILNSGDGDRLRTFIADNFAPESLAQTGVDELLPVLQRIYKETGGMVVLEVEPDGDHHIMLHLSSRDQTRFFRDEMRVTEDFPHRILSYKHAPADKPSTAKEDANA